MLQSKSVFSALRNFYTNGLMNEFDIFSGIESDGKEQNFMEQLEDTLKKKWNAEAMEKVFTALEKWILFLGEEENWVPCEFSKDEFFCMMRNANTAGLLSLIHLGDSYENSGNEKFVECLEEELKIKFNPTKLERMLPLFGKSIKFLANEDNWVFA